MSARKLKLNTITTGETLLDFETTDKYLISCVVFDGYLYSQGDVLTMFINNVNEPPVFDATTYYCTMPESNVRRRFCSPCGVLAVATVIIFTLIICPPLCVISCVCVCVRACLPACLPACVRACVCACVCVRVHAPHHELQLLFWLL